MPRVHPSDTKGDVTSLDRMGQRNLYLLIKSKDDGDEKEVWKFPQGGLEKGELLHEAAARDLTVVCGPYMDTWIVSRQPIGVYNPPSPSNAPKSFTFFYKAHILAGQVRRDSERVLFCVVNKGGDGVSTGEGLLARSQGYVVGFLN